MTKTADHIALDDLIPDPRNVRRHPDRNLNMVEQSLREVGAARSIVVDEEGTILAGNATWDISGFDPKAPPPKTAAFWDIVAAGRAPEDADIATSVEALDHPDAITVDDLADASKDLDFKAWLRERRNARQIPHRLEAAGYIAARNPGAKDGLWVVKGRRQVVYARKELSIRERIEAAQRRAARTW